MFARYVAPDSDEAEDSSDSGSGGPRSVSGSSSSSVRSTSGLIINMRNLTLNQVMCMETAGEGDSSQAAANGKSRERILQAMKKPCCRKRCKRLLNFKIILTFCVGFWSLSKSGQDCLLLGNVLCFVLAYQNNILTYHTVSFNIKSHNNISSNISKHIKAYHDISGQIITYQILSSRYHKISCLFRYFRQISPHIITFQISS